MSVLEPEEIRYASISAFGLIFLTTLLKWTGLGQTRYTPMKPNTADVTKVGDRTVLESFMEPSITQSGIDVVIDIVLTPIQLVVDFTLMWASVWNSMGFASIFLIVPMFVMIAILGGVALKLANTVIP